MDIVVVNDFGHVEGGASHVALSSATGLSARGHAVTLLCGVNPIMPELRQSAIDVVCTDQFDIAHDPSRLRAGLQGLWNLRSGTAMARVLASRDPARTVVHLHGWTKCLSSSVVRTAVDRGFKMVCTLNDYFTACPTGGFFDYPSRRACTLSPLSRGCLLSSCDRRGYSHKLWRVARQVVQRRYGLVPEGIHHYISVSDFSRSILRPFLPRDSRLYWNSNIINVSKAQRVPVDRNDAFVMVGRLTVDKGPGLFAQAAASLGCRAIFVGDGECREEVQRRYPEAVITGWRPVEEVLGFVRQARALVFPSLWYEAQPLVVLEAAALGVPAIVSDSCAARDSVIDGETGLWFRSGDLEDLSAKIALLQDDPVARDMGARAYERYWQNPSDADSHVNRLESIYEDVLRV
jgi:glycosyltransferase involved in cell wall biosynthesis